VNYRSIETLNQNIIEWIPKLPRDIDLIVGIPRSGLLAANLLALHLNLPFTDIEGFVNSRVMSAGVRCTHANREDFLRKSKRVLIIDDSLFTGTQMQRVKKTIQEANLQHSIYYAAVYVAPSKQNMIDLYYEVVPMPRIFEWNFMHHGDMANWCVDIDGVLCRDPTDEENDDGEKYMHFLKTVQPLIIPTVPVGWLVTCRLEKYRDITLDWLDRRGIKYKDLFMMNLPTKDIRIAAGNHASFKASIYKRKPATLFIESSLIQAMEIAKLSGKYVLCTETRDMIPPSYIGRTIQNQQRRLEILRRDFKEIPKNLIRFVHRSCLKYFKYKKE
jgi:orotate phosphoribosyltransferase